MRRLITQNPECRVTDRKLTRMRELQLLITDHVIAFCKAHDIEVVLDWGSLLGAVRHQGYIPWDDDIDLSMTRENYNKFIELYSQADTSPFEIRCPEVYAGCPQIFIKVGLKDTLFVLLDSTSPETCAQVAIDIFVLDEAPRDQKVCKKDLVSIALNRQLFISSQMWRAGNLQSRAKAAIFTLVRIVLHIGTSFVPRMKFYEAILKRVEHLRELAQERPVSERTFIGVEDPIINFRLDPAWLGDRETFSTVEFEGRQYPAPRDVHQWLTAQYGDYMTPPPPEKRYGHKPEGVVLGPWEDEDPKSCW